MSDSRSIGVFDSGVGGLTVLRALREVLPGESFVYLGDTARLPYGTKTAATVARYARQAAQALVDRDIKLLVIACNTASAVALDELRQHFAPLPVLGVVEPGAEAACRATQTGHIVVIGTEGTISGGAYDRAILGMRADAEVRGRPCPLFVGLAEEGWTTGPIPEAVARAYLEDLFLAESSTADCLVLGCTHFPVFRAVLAQVLGPTVTVVDSAATTALAVRAALQRHGLEASNPGSRPSVRFLATDGIQRFAKVGSIFLADPIDMSTIELVDL